MTTTIYMAIELDKNLMMTNIPVKPIEDCTAKFQSRVWTKSSRRKYGRTDVNPGQGKFLCHHVVTA